MLELFHDAREVHGDPSRVRGDHGVENLAVAAWMEEYFGIERGSYIWGRFVVEFSSLPTTDDVSQECSQHPNRTTMVRPNSWVRPQVEGLLP